MKSILDNRKILSTIFGLLITAFVLLTIVFGQNLLKLLKIGYSANVDSGVTIYAGFSEKDIHPTYENVSNYYETSYKPTHPSARALYKDENGHFVLPLPGFGNPQNRPGYTECTYEYYDNVTSSYKCSEDETYANPLKASTIILYDGNKYAIMITIDSIEYQEYYLVHENQLRDIIYKDEEIKDKLNDKNSIISLSTTHSHSTPSVVFLAESNKEKYPDLWWNTYYYKLFLFEQIKNSIKDALDNMYEANLSYSSIDVKDENNRTLNFIRHYNMNGKYKNGDSAFKGDNHGTYSWDSVNNKYVTNNSYNEENPHVELPDSTMQLLKIKYKDTDKTAHGIKDVLLINWQAHPGVVAGTQAKVISADFVGYMRKYLAAQSDFDYNVAYFTGSAGNLNVRDNVPSSFGEAMIPEVYFENQAYSAYSTKQKVEAAIAIGNKLGEYVKRGSNNNFTDVDVDKIKINSLREFYYYKPKMNSDSIMYQNAYYVSLIYSSTQEGFKSMLEGTYEWPSDLNFDLINYDSDGKELAAIVKSVVSSGIIGSNILTLTPVSTSVKPSGYECSIGSSFTLSTKYLLLNIIGVDLDNLETEEVERIYSGYHAARTNSNNKSTTTGVMGELNAVSIGDFSFVTLPNEPFASIGRNIKSNSKSNMTFVLGYSNGYIGYLPDSAAYDYGCYEVDNSYYIKGTGERVQNDLIEMISDISIKKLEWVTLPTNIEAYAHDDDVVKFVGGTVKITYANGSSEVVGLNSLNRLGVTSAIDPESGKEKLYIGYRDHLLVLDVEDEIASNNLEISEEAEKLLEDNRDVKTINGDIKDNDKKIYGTTDNPKTFRQTIFTTIISFLLLIVTGIMLYKINKKMAINTL